MKKREWFDIEPITPAIIGFTSIIIGIVLIWYGFLFFGSLYFTVGIGFFTASLALQSSKITKKIAYSSFQEAMGEFEDRRITIRDKYLRIGDKQNLGLYNGRTELKLDIYDLQRYASFSMWKCYTYFKQAMNFREYLRYGDRKNLVHYINLYFDELVTVKRNFGLVLTDGYKDNLENMYDEIKNYDVYEEKKDWGRNIRNNLAILQSDR